MDELVSHLADRLNRSFGFLKQVRVILRIQFFSFMKLFIAHSRIPFTSGIRLKTQSLQSFGDRFLKINV